MKLSSAKATERQLHLRWQKVSAAQGALVTQQGRTLQVLYPGRHSSQKGPDFRDAVLLQQGKIIKGDVEVHVKASGWKEHGHHQDPNYNSVVLHVVSHAQGRAVSPLRSNMEAPILVMDTDDSQGGSKRGDLSQSELCLKSPESLGSVLDDCGDYRFAAKSRGLALEMEAAGEDEALYRGLMDSMGYGDNRRAFQELARHLPYSTFALLSKEPPATRLVAISALLISAGGFMGEMRKEESAEAKALLRQIPLSKSKVSIKWNLFRIRPQNHPMKRLAGMAQLIDRHLAKGLSRGLLDAFRDEESAGLMKALAVPPYIGKGRTADMVVNVALPFLHAWSQKARDHSLARRCWHAYSKFPSASENRITREMKRLLGMQSGAELAMTARRQQGLICLYRFWLTCSGEDAPFMVDQPDHFVEWPQFGIMSSLRSVKTDLAGG